MGLDINFNKVHRKDIGYFRKVNFLVGFFENRGYIVENLVPIEITLDDAKELLNRCNQVLEDHSKAEELLPTCSGFFFGNYDYDEYYFNDVNDVKTYVENTLIPELEEIEEDHWTNIEFVIWY